MTGKPVSKQTQKNWWIDASLALTAVIAALSGIYFLYLPSGGYMGGRNPLYNVTVLFSRHTWDQIHLWGGLAMILAATVHLERTNRTVCLHESTRALESGNECPCGDQFCGHFVIRRIFALCAGREGCN